MEGSNIQITSDLIDRAKKGEKISQLNITIDGVTYHKIEDVPEKYQDAAKSLIKEQLTNYVVMAAADAKTISLNHSQLKFIRFALVSFVSIIGIMEGAQLNYMIKGLLTSYTVEVPKLLPEVVGLVSGIIGLKVAERHFKTWFEGKKDIVPSLSFVEQLIRPFFIALPSAAISGFLIMVFFGIYILFSTLW